MPDAPVLTSADPSKTSTQLFFEWTLTGDDYEVYVDGVLVETVTGAPSFPYELPELTLFQDYSVKVKAVVGGVSSDFSNTITDYPSYGPVTITGGGATTSGLTVPAGSWTVATLLWGASVPLPTGLEMNRADTNDLYNFDGTNWLDEVDFSTIVDSTAISGAFSLINPSSAFTIWNGLGP